MRPMQPFALFVAAALSLVLAGCASVPDVDGIVDRSRVPARPDIVGAHGPLNAARSDAVVQRLEHQSGDTDVLQRDIDLETALADNPIIVGNKLTLLRNGRVTFQAMFQAMRRAKNHINLEYFIVEDVQQNGQLLSDLLVEKRRQGVEINVIYDAIGSIDTPSAFFDKLKAAGVKVLEFHPLDPLTAKGGYSINDRDHRKILIVDGAHAIIGGVNLSSVYERSLSAKLSVSKSDKDIPWLDTDIEIEGPAVKELEKIFLAAWWNYDGSPLSVTSEFFPAVPEQGRDAVRILGSTPDHPIPNYYVSLLTAIRNAEKTIWVSAAYFVPTEDEIDALLDAARRGVDVRLLLPGFSDSGLALSAGHSYYSDLLEAGVKIYETRNTILHTKMVIIDGVWAAIGSSNFDHRSVLFNNEVDAVILGRDATSQMAAMLRDEIARANVIDAESWAQRPIGERLKELFARTWTVLL